MLPQRKDEVGNGSGLTKIDDRFYPESPFFRQQFNKFMSGQPDALKALTR